MSADRVTTSTYTFKQTWALAPSSSQSSRTFVKGSKTVSSDSNMGWCSMNTVVLRTPTGILKILEFIVVLICLMLARFGNDGHILNFGTYDHKFVGIGTIVGYAIIVPAILCTYLMGANLTFLELFINFIGGVLFVTTGALTIEDTRRRSGDQTAQMALGCLCVAAGILFLIDFLFSVKNTRVTVVRSTRTI